MTAQSLAMYRRVAHGSSAYSEAVALRERILRAPQGLAFDVAELAAEQNSYHLVCEHNGRVVACVVLEPLAPDRLKLRQMAVSDTARGQGIGLGLVRHAEQLAQQKGYKQIVLSARISGQGFYQRLGYTAQGEPFEEVRLPHIYMTKQL